MSILDAVRPPAEVRTPVGGARTPAPAGRTIPVLRRIGRIVVSLLLVGSALVFLLLAVGPHVLGYRTATMLTGSMAPGIMPGDVVVTVPSPASEVAVGDVISYRIPIEDQRVETHRVTEVTRGPDGRVSVQTKGDANENIDPWVATIEGDTVWQVKGVVPGLGTAIRALRSPIVQDGVLWIALAGSVGLGFSTIWSGEGRPRGGARRAR